jgi:hypothetical protein
MKKYAPFISAFVSGAVAFGLEKFIPTIIDVAFVVAAILFGFFAAKNNPQITNKLP